MRPVKDPRYVFSVLSVLHPLCGSGQDMKMEQSFPGAIPVSMRRGDLELVAKGRYMVSPKFDGERFMLLLTRLGPDKTPCAFFVNRRCQVFEALVAADDTFFNNTLLDGELLGENFWAFDLITIQGRILSREPFIERHHLLCTILASHLEVGRPVLDPDVVEEAIRLQTIISMEPTLRLRPKPFYPITQIGAMVERLYDDAGLNMDGLIFMPTHESVCGGTHRTQFKWKWQHTIDLEVGPQGELTYRSRSGAKSLMVNLLQDGVMLNPEAYIGNRVPPKSPRRIVPTLDDPVRHLWKFQQLAANQASLPGTNAHYDGDGHDGDGDGDGQGNVNGKPKFIWEFEILGQTLTLRPVRLRLDKGQPNNDWTVQQTFINAEENITATELIQRLST